MSRPVGVRNKDFEEKKQALLEALTDFLLSEGVELPSFRQMAIAAGTSEPTLRHYFSNRSGVIVAVFEYMHKLSVPLRQNSAQPGRNLAESIDEYIDLVANSRKVTRYIRAHGLGIREGMNSEQAREAYLRYLLLPAIDSIAEKLVRTPNGPKNYETARLAGVMLLAPSIFIILHQELLNGKTHSPIDVDLYLEQVKKWMKDGIGSSLDALSDD